MIWNKKAEDAGPQHGVTTVASGLPRPEATKVTQKCNEAPNEMTVSGCCEVFKPCGDLIRNTKERLTKKRLMANTKQHEEVAPAQTDDSAFYVLIAVYLSSFVRKRVSRQKFLHAPEAPKGYRGEGRRKTNWVKKRL